MRDIKKILELRAQNRSQRFIAESLGISRNTIRKIFKSADENGVYWDVVRDKTEKEIEKILFPESSIQLSYVQPDMEHIHHELLKTGVTLKLLWEEYVQGCRSINKPFYHRTQFNKLYHDYVKKNNLTMHITHKPGDKLFVDWNGKTMYVTDRYTGDMIPAYIFVATLPFSMYSYVQACPSMDSKNWIECHVNAYKYFNGATRLLIPDNLKTGVISHKRYGDPVLNRSYQELADHYGTTIVPARIRSPKDKAAVEGTVGVITTAIMAHLRNQTFFSFDKLNESIRKELDIFNTEPFQKKEGSRRSVFKEEEEEFMLPLPEHDFEWSQWKQVTVQRNYHVSIEKMNYSVPYEYVGKRVEAKITSQSVNIYYKGTMICSHKRLYGRMNQYSTNEQHMPENHRMFRWNKDKFIEQAESIGTNTREIIQKLFDRYKAEEQAYNGCLSILKLADKYSSERLENACNLAIEYISNPTYRNIRMILESGQDLKNSIEKEEKEENLSYACLRGKKYYEQNK